MKRLLWLLSLLPRGLRHEIIRRMNRVDDEALNGIRVKVATTVEEFKAAARLLQSAYVQRGLVASHPSGMRVTPHLLLPATVVFIALRGEEVVGTLSLIPDSPVGLPMDSVYGDSLKKLRAQGRRLAEVGALCVAPGSRHQGIAFLLNKMMWQCAALLEVDDLVMAVHPMVEDIYSAMLPSTRMGEERLYPGLNKVALAVALRVDLHLAEQRAFARHGHRPFAYHNPYYMYWIREDEQVEVPEDPLFAHRTRLTRVQAAKELMEVRPDALTGLSENQAGPLMASLARAFIRATQISEPAASAMPLLA